MVGTLDYWRSIPERSITAFHLAISVLIMLARFLRRAAARFDAHVEKRLPHLGSGRGGDVLARQPVDDRLAACRGHADAGPGGDARSRARPLSAMVGTSGRLAKRRSEPTASAFNWLPLMSDRTGPTSSNATLQLVAAQRGDEQRIRLERHDLRVDACHRLQQLGGEELRAADIDRADVELAADSSSRKRSSP